ncbi:MAG: FAD-dependent oxidoreductase [Deltaproteobacteria bacterium]|nr:FAD-dependent oxidoreductase [Deltaproteobacteria bacterium]
MPYYIGDVIGDSSLLVARTPEEFEKSGIRVMLNTSVESIDLNKKVVALADERRIPFDLLGVATGSTAHFPAIPLDVRDGVFVLKNLNDGLALKSYITKKSCRRVLVVGAGFIAMELCEAFRNLDLETVIVHRGDRPVARWDPELTQLIVKTIETNGVSFMTGRTASAVEGRNGRIRLLTDKESFEGDLVVFAAGVRPNTAVAKAAGIEIGATGAIKVDALQRASSESVFAVGDCSEAYHRISKKWVNLPLGDVANKQGRVAGRVAAGLSAAFPGVVGSQAFKVFNLEAAATGLTEEEAASSGFKVAAVTLWGSPMAHSMSKGRKLGLKLVADSRTGKLLGAQAVGHGGAWARINMLSVCLWADLSIDELMFMDMAYAPPFGGAWDLVHVAAQQLAKRL